VRSALLLLAGLTATSVLAHRWACFHGDPQHSGRSENVVGAPLAQKESYQAGGQISGSPVIRSNGRVLVGARDVKLYCLDGNLSSPFWISDLSALGSDIYLSSPALDDSGNAYITTNRKLVKVHGDSGTVLWSWPSHNSLHISHSPVIGQDGKVYFACYSDSLYALNPEGTLAWARPLGHSANSAPAIGLDGNVLVATTRDAAPWHLWSFKPNGDSAWARVLDGDADFASPAIGPDSTVYIGANRYLYAVRPDGTLKWRDSLTARIRSCPAVANESTLYVVAGVRLYCLDTDSGVRWRRTIGGSDNYCSPVVDADGNVYVGTASGTGSFFYCIGPDSTVRDSHVFSADIVSSPAIGTGGCIYLGCKDSSLCFFQGPGPGVAEFSRRSRPTGIRLLPNPTHGVVRMVPPGRYSVRVFDACGALVATASDADRVDLRGLCRGVYMIQVVASGCPPLKLVLR
jgi:outer membrane protein assembly factor BamB